MSSVQHNRPGNMKHTERSPISPCVKVCGSEWGAIEAEGCQEQKIAAPRKYILRPALPEVESTSLLHAKRDSEN
jgi:hypothetical protein